MKKLKTHFFLSIVALILFGYFLWRQSNFELSYDFEVKIPKGYSSLGIDVSHHQGKIEWEVLFDSTETKSSIDFVYVKATEGEDHLDRQWSYNRNKLNDLNIKYGAYHFFQSKKLPAPQATHFLNHWYPKHGDLPPVLDVEIEGFDDKDLRHKVERWLNIVEERTGMRPIIYTSLNFYLNKFKGYFPKHKFWIASYSRDPLIKKDTSIVHWQFSESAQLPFHDTRVDLNVSKLKLRIRN